MSQLNWTYVDDDGKFYNVGLYHGDKSRHVLVYVNRSLLIIDFSIFESKKYTFYLGEELCDIKIHLENEDEFTYGMEINHEVHTPLNMARREYFNKYLIWSILLVILFFSIVGIVSYLTIVKL